MDSDLAESISALKQAITDGRIRAEFGKANPDRVSELRTKLKLPRRYREFLLEADPVDVETVTPGERVRLFGSRDLEKEQIGHALEPDGSLITGPRPSGWRPSWVIVAHSTLLGDPYFLDVNNVDAEGDCQVFTAMSGKEQWKPKLCASSFAMFVRILALGLEVARGFDLDDYDVDDEGVFREALGPRIRECDPAALKAGHWT